MDFTKKAIAPLIAGVLYFGIVMAAITIIITIINPYMENAKDQIAINYAKKNIADIDNVISSLASQEEGAARTFNLEVSRGNYYLDKEKNAVYFSINASKDILSPRFRRKTGNVFFGTQLNSKAEEYNSYFILENQYLRVNISKTGNASSYSAINTSEIINSILFKEKNIYLYQQNISIIPDNNIEQENGTGYVYLKESGNFLPNAVAVARMISAGNNASFDIYFDLQSDSDFLMIYLKNYTLS